MRGPHPLWLVLPLLIWLSSACAPGAPTPAPLAPEFVSACLALGGDPQSVIEYGGGSFAVCRFPDGTSCSASSVMDGACASQARPGPTTPNVTPFPTKESLPPVTPVVKGADPFPGWATFTSPEYRLGFRFPDTWRWEENPHLIRLTRNGLELLIQVRRAGEAVNFSADLPYEGAVIPGAELLFFQKPVLEQQHLVSEQVLAVSYGTPDNPLDGGENEYVIQLLSLHSDEPINDLILGEVRQILRSFEVWNNR